MTTATWLVFALGAGIGAPLRFTIDAAVEARNDEVRPRGTLVVNAIGSLLLGVIVGLALRGHITGETETVVGTAFLGSLTTFSTFAVETVRLFEAGEVEEAITNIALHSAIAIVLATVGYALVLTVA